MKPTFTTGDIILASFLAARGHEVTDLACVDRHGRFSFIFVDGEKLRADSLDFLEDGLIPARLFAKKVGQLKKRCRQRWNAQQENTKNEKQATAAATR